VQQVTEELTVTDLLKQLEMKGHKVQLLDGSFGPQKTKIEKHDSTIDKQALKSQLKE
jgi:sulfur carrier protein ThiS